MARRVEVLFLLIPLSLLALLGAVWVFLKMNGSGQFDDCDSRAVSILMDDDLPAAAPGAGQVDHSIPAGPIDGAKNDTIKSHAIDPDQGISPPGR